MGTGSPMAQQACDAVQGCVSYGAGYIMTSGPGETDILSSQIRQRLPLEFAQMAKQQARTVLPFPLNGSIISEARMQLPLPYRLTLDSCIDAYKCNKISPEDMIAFCRSMSSYSDVLFALFSLSNEAPAWPMSCSLAGSSLDSTSSSSSSSSFTSMSSSSAPTSEPAGSARASTSPQSNPQSSYSAASSPRCAKRQKGLTADDLAAQALIMMVSHVSPLKQPMEPPPSQPTSLTLPPISLLLSSNEGASSSSTPYDERSNSASAGSSSGHASCSPKTTPSSPLNSSSAGAASSSSSSSSSSIGRPCMTKKSLSKAAASSAASKHRGGTASQDDRGDLPITIETLPTPLGAAAATKGVVGVSSPTSEEGAHNKYCHFCQHIKVKKASSMHACENRGCNRRFCDHCLTAHMKEEALDPMASSGPWHCPICRKTCCCTMGDCGQAHRHCKAYRYRRKRAARAVATDSRGSEAPPSIAVFQGGAQQHQILAAGSVLFPQHRAGHVPHELVFAFAAAQR